MEKYKKIQNILTCALFVLSLALGGLLLFVLPEKTYSEVERRQLREAPEGSLDAVMDGRFFDQLDDWTADHFAGRELFRRVKAVWQTGVMLEKENNGLTVVDGSIVRIEKTLNEASYAYAGERLRAIYSQYIAGTECKLYAALIPDKSAFLRERGYPAADYAEAERLFADNLPQARLIGIKDALMLQDYFLTDTHWRQDRILPAANLLLRSMGGQGTLDVNDYAKETYAPFYGVYAGQSALDPSPDEIVYLSGGPLEGARVLDYGTMQIIPIYDPDGCDARDPYTLFLGGSKGFLRLENPNVKNGRELIVFRDSFASSIAPLLLSEYESVTLIDTRYFHPSLLGRYLRFDSQDVLFLYSETLMNDSRGMN